MCPATGSSPQAAGSGGYGGQEALKRALLVAEGVPVAGGRVRDLSRVRWTRPWLQHFNTHESETFSSAML